jgi:MFS family permease
VLLGIATLNFFMVSSAFIPSPILDIMSSALSLSPAQDGILFSAPLLMVALFSVPAGMLGDKWGPTKIITIGGTLLFLGTVFRGAAPDFLTMVAFTLVDGVGWAMLYPNYAKVIKEWFPPERIGLATGIYFMAQTIGLLSVLSLTRTILYPAFGSFRGVFFFFGGLLGVAVLYWIVVPKKRSDQGQTSRNPTMEVGMGGISKAWLQRNILLAAGLFFIENFISFTFNGWLPTFIARLGADMATGTLVTALYLVGGAVGLFAFPSISDQLGSRKPALAMALCITAIIVFLIPSIGLLPLYAASTLLGVTLLGMSGILFIVPVETLDRNLVGKATGVIISIGYIGSFAGPFISGYLIQLTGSVPLVLYVLGVSGIAGVVISLLMREPSEQRRVKAHGPAKKVVANHDLRTRGQDSLDVS